MKQPQQHPTHNIWISCVGVLCAFTPICLKVHVVAKWQWISGVSLFQRWSAILFIIYSPRDYREYGPNAAGQMLRTQHLSYMRPDTLLETDASADYIWVAFTILQSIEWIGIVYFYSIPLSRVITSCWYYSNTSATWPWPPRAKGNILNMSVEIKLIGHLLAFYRTGSYPIISLSWIFYLFFKTVLGNIMAIHSYWRVMNHSLVYIHYY